MKPLTPLLAGVTVIWEVVTPKKGLGSADLVSGVGQPGQPAPYPRREEGLRPTPAGKTAKCRREHSRAASQGALVVKKLPASAGDTRDVGSTPGSGRSPGGGHGNAFWYSCLENPMDRGAWRAAVHWVTVSQTRLK